MKQNTSKKALISSLAILITILAGVLIYKYLNELKFSRLPNPASINQENNQSADPKKFNLPVALDNPKVTAALVHYFLSGKLQEVIPVAGGTKITLENSVGLPDLIISSSTRVSKITQPYETSKPVFLSVKDLKPGQTLDLSIEYDLNRQSWFLLDVYLPADKNK